MNPTALLISLFFCHWLADFTALSTPWMLNAKKFGKPLFPIFIHATTHGLLMSIPLLVALGFTDLLGYLISFEIATHFAIDVWKGRMNAWFPPLQNHANKYYWWLFGLDQFLHATVIILMVGWAI
ncbi:MAG: DUF3307 domain-containing protein [Bacteroidetes bacterium]|nr:DUF3307 domain-containing protein [Bacteroidota bacterium]